MLPFTRRFLQRRLIHASRSFRAACSNCHQDLLSPLPACKKCGYIARLPPAITYHEVLEIPAEPNPMKVDVKDLQNKFRRGQAVCHPDTWASQGETKQNIAQELSARLNEAYQTLSNPLNRVEYLLSLHYTPLGEAEKVHDMEFMMEIMEAREVIDDASQGDSERILSLRDQNQGHISDTTKELEDLVAQKDWAKVKEGAIRLRYLFGIDKAANKWLDQHT